MLRLTRSVNRYAGASSCSSLLSRRSYTSESRPWIASSSMNLVDSKDGRYLEFKIPGVAKKTETESDETLCFFAKMPGVKKEDVKACVEKTITGAYLLSIQGTKKKYYDDEPYNNNNKVIYHAYIGLPAATNHDMINTEMLQDGMLEVTMPKPKRKHHNFFSKHFVILLYKFYLRFCYTMPTVIMTIARRSVINLFCAHPWESFTMYKKEETGKTFHISVTPGLHKKDAFVGGVCISLNMPELSGIEEVKSFFKYDTLFIQGKTTTNNVKVSYVTGIRLPQGYTRKRSMIKEEMLQGGMYKATIPLVT